MMIKTMKVSIYYLINYNIYYQYYKGAKKTEEMMKIPVIRHKYKKPACIHEVSYYHTNASINTNIVINTNTNR